MYLINSEDRISGLARVIIKHTVSYCLLLVA